MSRELGPWERRIYEEIVGFNSGKSDSFGRLRSSSPLTLFDSKQLFDSKPFYFDDQEVSGSGTTSVFSAARASTTIGVASTTAGKRVRQTFQRWNYQPGKSQLVLLTGVLGNSGSGITAGMGYYDDENGVFIQSNEGTVSMVVRSSVSGSPIDNVVVQSSWNGDKLDGTGDSGKVLDPTKAQIWWCDLEWLGVGTARTGFVIDGQFILCHTFNHANVIDSVYMSTPNLPVRYEIENDGTGAASTLEHICCSVISEGGLDSQGELKYATTGGTHIDATSADTIYACIGLRLKPSSLGQMVAIEGISMINATPDNFEWLLIFNPTVAGTFTYTDKINSQVQTAISSGAAGNTVTGGEILSGGFIKSGIDAGSINAVASNAVKLGAAIDGTPDEIVLCCRPLAQGADIDASITWRELS